MEWMRIDQDIAVATCEALLPPFNENRAFPEDGMRFVIEEATKAANVRRDDSMKEVADLSILREAQRGGGNEMILDFQLH